MAVGLQMAARPERIRDVVVVAAEPVVREGLRVALDGRFRVVVATGLVADARKALDRYLPAGVVVVLDPPPPDAPPAAVCRTLLASHPNTGLLALFRQPTPERVALVSRQGATGIYQVDTELSDLAAALAAVVAGDRRVQPKLERLRAAGWDSAPADEAASVLDEAPPRLSARQLHVLRLLAHGDTTKEIARLLRISADAVDHLVERAAQRMGASHRAQAMVLAMRHGLLN